MSYSNRVSVAQFLKTLLVICGVGLLVAAIWFFGPYFGFGDSRPLESVGSRLVFIPLAVLCLVCFWLRWRFCIVVMATLGVLVWVLGPFLLVGESHPLEPVGVRLMIIGIMFIVALLYGLWLLLLTLKSNPALLDKFTHNKAPVVERRGEEDASEVAAVIARAVDYVNKNRSNLSFFQRFIRVRKPLDLLPWYMIIGTAGAGKTSAILASGQNFPLPEQLNQIGKPAQQTRNCECWFANDAIYVDTAGKYVSDPDKHQPEWRAMLKALKKHRPVKALSGAIVSFSAADVLGRSQSEQFELAAGLRTRIDDLRQTLGVRFPVYVLVTKLDQLPGFSEYFRILTEQEREQVWGVTFPYGEACTTSVSELHSQLKTEFLLLEDRIERDMIVRQQEEYDNRDRKKMYALPQDFNLLAGMVADVVHNIFFASRYDETQSYTMLRGIYFASSHQPAGHCLLNNQSIMRKWSNYVENKTPATMASLTVQPDERDFLINDVSYGRQYFLKQLFTDVIIKDRDLARHNLVNESKFRLQRLVGHTFCIVLTFILLNGFWNSYHNNSEYLDTINDKVTALGTEVNSYISTPNDSLLPRLLMLSQYLPEYGALDVFNPELKWRYGLYTGTDVVEASNSLYQFFLQRLLLPQIEQQVTQALQDSVDTGSSERVYSQLKLYLQVFGQGKLDQQYMINNITRLWEITGKLQSYEEKRIFIAHLTNLFASSEWRRYGQKPDDSMVKYARALLEREDFTTLLYERIKDSVTQDVPADLTLAMMAKSRGGELFTFVDENGVTSVPGLFTRAGYYDVFKKKITSGLMWLVSEDSWVLGKTAGDADNESYPQFKLTGDGGMLSPVQQKILGLYLDEYTRQWQDFLGNIRIKKDIFQLNHSNAGVAEDLYILRALGASDSPLVNLVSRAVSETTLAMREDKSLLDNVRNKGRLLNVATKVNQAWIAAEKKLLQERVDNHFLRLREFVTGGGEATGEARPISGTELEKLLGVLNEQYTLFAIYNDELKNGKSVALSSKAQKISAESQSWPAPLPNLVGPLLEGAWRHVNEGMIARSNEGIEDHLGQVCRATLQGRYPFANSKRDVKLADFERFFAVGGLADEYYKKNLADKVDTSSHPWRYKGNIQDHGRSLKMFEQAAEIRNAFFQGDDGRKFSLTFDVSVPYLDPAITQLNMNFDGKQVNYAHWPVAPVSVVWPSSRTISRVTLNATPHIAVGNSSRTFSGPWSLFRWMESADDIVSTEGGETQLIFDLDSRRTNIEISGLTYKDRPITGLLKNFRCPGNG